MIQSIVSLRLVSFSPVATVQQQDYVVTQSEDKGVLEGSDVTKFCTGNIMHKLS
jgi:hypothetical protein